MHLCKVIHTTYMCACLLICQCVCVCVCARAHVWIRDRNLKDVTPLFPLNNSCYAMWHGINDVLNPLLSYINGSMFQRYLKLSLGFVGGYFSMFRCFWGGRRDAAGYKKSFATYPKHTLLGIRLARVRISWVPGRYRVLLEPFSSQTCMMESCVTFLE